MVASTKHDLARQGIIPLGLTDCTSGGEKEDNHQHHFLNCELFAHI